MATKSFSQHIHLRIIAVCVTPGDTGHLLQTNMPTAILHTVRLVQTDFGIDNIALSYTKRFTADINNGGGILCMHPAARHPVPSVRTAGLAALQCCWCPETATSTANTRHMDAHALHLTAGCTSLLLRLAAAATNWHMQPQTSQYSP